MSRKNTSSEATSNSSKDSATRRALLQAIGAGVAVSGYSGVGVANSSGPSPEKIYEQALHIRKRTGSVEKFHKYLRNHGFEVKSKENEFSKQSGDISPQRIKDHHMTGTLTLSEYSIADFDGIADYHVEVESDKWFGPGEDPEDHVSISWPWSDWDLHSNGTYINNGDNVLLQESQFNGADWSFDDYNSCMYGCDLWFAVGAYLEAEDPDSPPRKVQATYQSVWSDDGGGSLTDFSIDTDGTVSWNISGGGSSDVDKEQIDRQVAEED